MPRESITYEEAIEHIALQEIEERQMISTFNGMDAVIGKGNAASLRKNVEEAFEAGAELRIKAIADLFGVAQGDLTNAVRQRRREIKGAASQQLPR